MAEYLIEEEELTEISDYLRENFEEYDFCSSLIFDRDSIKKIIIPDGT
jgi:hypothetical protein